VSYEISTDGINYKSLTTAVNVSNNVGKPNANWVFTSQTNTKEPIRKIRVTGKSMGKCPKGHLGEGFDSWLFADEIILR
jgi:hexosaminidase